MKKFGLLAAMICAAFTLTACSETGYNSADQPGSSFILFPNSSEPLNSNSGSNSEPNSSSTQTDPSTNSSSISDINSSSTQSNSSSTQDNSSSASIYIPPEKPPEITTPQSASMFYCVDNKQLIAGENTDKYIAPASILKLLTASVALKYVSPDTVFTVGTELELVPPNSSLCLIAPGHRLTLYDLISGMLMSSGNDAAYTVAVSVAREVSTVTLGDTEAVAYFCGMMNAFAKDLGMDHSYFVTPDGSDDSRQYTTVSDLLLLAQHALSVPQIREIASTYQRRVVFASGHIITWTNTNKLLNPESEYYCADAIGLKTGTTAAAGYNLIAAFNKNGKTYIFIAAGCGSDSERYKQAKNYYSRI